MDQKKHGQAETKPFTNFSVFHDNLITRLKALSQIQLDLDRRCKEAEARFADKFNEMRKQMESRWKQLDKFEMSVKAIAEAKSTWRKKMSAKEGEIEALKVRGSLSQVGDVNLMITWAVIEYGIAVAADKSRSHVWWGIHDGNTFTYGPVDER